MDKWYKIRYTDIPNETVLFINGYYDKDEILSILEEANKIDDITCVVFNNTYNIQEIRSIINSLDLSNMKYGWNNSNSKNIPFMSDILLYIKLEKDNDTLYMQTNSDFDSSSYKKIIWVPIKKITKKDLDPMDPLYFEKFDELKNKNN